MQQKQKHHVLSCATTQFCLDSKTTSRQSLGHKMTSSVFLIPSHLFPISSHLFPSCSPLFFHLFLLLFFILNSQQGSVHPSRPSDRASTQCCLSLLKERCTRWGHSQRPPTLGPRSRQSQARWAGLQRRLGRQRVACRRRHCTWKRQRAARP